jgi:hypothetical protein
MQVLVDFGYGIIQDKQTATTIDATEYRLKMKKELDGSAAGA